MQLKSPPSLALSLYQCIILNHFSVCSHTVYYSMRLALLLVGAYGDIRHLPHAQRREAALKKAKEVVSQMTLDEMMGLVSGHGPQVGNYVGQTKPVPLSFSFHVGAIRLMIVIVSQCGLMVMTFASHAKGSQFDPGH